MSAEILFKMTMLRNRSVISFSSLPSCSFPILLFANWPLPFRGPLGPSHQWSKSYEKISCPREIYQRVSFKRIFFERSLLSNRLFILGGETLSLYLSLIFFFSSFPSLSSFPALSGCPGAAGAALHSLKTPPQVGPKATRQTKEAVHLTLDSLTIHILSLLCHCVTPSVPMEERDRYQVFGTKHGSCEYNPHEAMSKMHCGHR